MGDTPKQNGAWASNANFVDFLRNIKLRDDNGMSFSQFVQIPAEVQDQSLEQMFMLTENLYNTYDSVLRDFQENVLLRNQLQKQLQALKAQIDQLEEKVYGHVQSPFERLSKYVDTCTEQYTGDGETTQEQIEGRKIVL